MRIGKKGLRIAHDLFNKHCFRKVGRYDTLVLHKCTCDAYGAEVITDKGNIVVVPLEECLSFNQDSERNSVKTIREIQDTDIRISITNYLKEQGWFDGNTTGELIYEEMIAGEKPKTVNEMFSE